MFFLLQKVKYDIGAEILLSTCTLDVQAVLRSYNKVQPAIDTEISSSIDLGRSQGRRSNFENRNYGFALPVIFDK